MRHHHLNNDNDNDCSHYAVSTNSMSTGVLLQLGDKNGEQVRLSLDRKSTQYLISLLQEALQKIS